MSYNAKGHIRLPGNAYVGTGENSAKSCHAYFTNDDAAAVQTDGYFDAASTKFETGDILTCSLDLDGTPALKQYVVVRTGGDIALTVAAA